MGQGQSFSEAELKELQKGNSLTEEQLLRLLRRFQKLDLDGDGEITVKEFESIPELKRNPLLGRVLAVFDTDGGGSVDFKEFVRALAIFSNECDKAEKLKFTFRIYDIDMDGYISNKDLFQALQIMVTGNLTDTQLQQVVDRTMHVADEDGDGLISYPEYAKIVESSDFGDKLTLKM